MPGVPSHRGSSQAKPAGRRGPGGNEEVTRSPSGRETPKSEHEAESGGPAAQAHSCPRSISWARDLSGAPSPVPSPGQPEPAAARLREQKPAESELEPTPQRARGRALRACPWGRDGPRPHLLGILVGPVPPPPPSARPAVLRAAWALGPPSALRDGATLSVHRCGAVCRAVSLSRAVGPCRPAPPCGRSALRTLLRSGAGPPRSSPATDPARDPGGTRLRGRDLAVSPSRAG